MQLSLQWVAQTLTFHTSVEFSVHHFLNVNYQQSIKNYHNRSKFTEQPGTEGVARTHTHTREVTSPRRTR